LLLEHIFPCFVLDEVTLNKMKSGADFSLPTLSRVDRSTKQPVVGILKKGNVTQGSICEVEDFSFDDTQDLCESPSRLIDDISCAGEQRRQSSGKRSRSIGRRDDDDETNNYALPLETIASPRKDPSFAARKKVRRSRSAVAFDVADSCLASEDETVELGGGRQQRAYSLNERSEAAQRRESRGGGGALTPRPGIKPAGEQLHTFVQKTVLKQEKCFVCLKRIKFGTTGLKCAGCRVTGHSVCCEKGPPLCLRSLSPEVCVTPRVEGGGGRSPSKKAFFASPMLR